MLLFRLEPCHYFWNWGSYPSIKSALKEDSLCLKKKILDGRAPDYLSEKLLSLKYHKSHDKRVSVALSSFYSTYQRHEANALL